MQSVICAFSAFLRVSFKVSVLALIVGLFVVSANIPPAHAATGINQQINFQGRLLNTQGAAVADGNYNIQFKIYQDGAGTAANNPGGTLKWTENWTNQAGKGVQVKNGYMSVQLGAINPFGTQVDWNQDTLWLSINIGNTNATCTPVTACGLDGEMLPMKRLSSTPFAMNSQMLGGMTSAEFLQIAKGVQTDVSNNTSSIYLNKTGTSGNFLQLQSGGTDAFTINSGGDLSFGANKDHTISVAASAAGTDGKNLSLSAGSAGTGGGAGAGGTLTLQGGNAAGSGNASGGDVNISGGTGVGIGAHGIVNLGASAYTSGTNATCSTSCTIAQSLVDGNGTVIVSATDPSVSITLPAPSRQISGRVIYVTTTDTSSDFTLVANSGANLINVTMKANTTATMIWNGTAWTPGGASNAITLQATYNNGTNPSATPEIKLDSIRSTIDIQDADTSIGADIFNIRGSNGGTGGLGQVLFGVGNDGRVTIQGTTNQSSAFRVMNAAGEYLYNINSSNGYVISNSISAPDNQITNPGFEAGGSVAGGEEGWFGSAQGSFPNDSANARTGNYSLSVSPNGITNDFYAGTYREVTPGEDYYFTGYIKQSGANGNAGIQITWYNKDKGIISYSTDYATPVTGSYTQRTVNATAPAGAVYARVSATVRNNANAGTYYFDDFTFKRSTQSAPYSFRNTTDSASAFRIQSAGGGQTLFTANTSNNILKVGDNTGTDTQVTMLVVDSASVDPTTVAGRDGGLFYNSTSNSLKAVIGGAVVDICTTAVTCAGYSASAGSVIQLQTNSPGTTQVGNFNINGTGILANLKSHDSTSGAGENLNIKAGNSTAAGAKGGDLILDSGTGPGGQGNIIIGHAGVNTTMAGGLAIQGSGIGSGTSTLTLGNASTVSGSVTFNSSAGTNAVTLKGPDVAGTAYSLILPGSAPGAGECMKVDGTGHIYYQNCGVGANVNLQDVYNNSSTPANITLTDGKNFQITSNDTATDGNFIMNLNCSANCSTSNGGRFAVQSNGVDAFSIFADGTVSIGGNRTNAPDTDLTLLRLDSYDVGDDGGLSCGSNTNSGALYYNNVMGSIRGCVGNAWVDISNPDTLGLLTFGIIPSSGGANNAYDLPSLKSSGVTGPCKVSFNSANSVSIQACTAYSGGQRVTYNGGTVTIPFTASNQWSHICMGGAGGAITASTPSTSPTANLPTWSVDKPILCLADVRSTSAGAVGIAAIYDTRTFSSTLKEAVNTSEAVELGNLVKTNASGAMAKGTSASAKLYGVVIVADSATPTSGTGAPNAIVATVGPAWIKSVSGTAGGFVIESSTAGYAQTTTNIPNNSFYYSGGNTRTSFTAGSTTTICSSANACSGSLYANFIVR